MSLMTDMLRQSIANSGVSVRVGDSRNLEPSKDEGTRSDDDNAWKYISVGDFSGLSDYTDREYDYRKIPFFGQFFGHAADAATDGIASLAQFAGFEKAGDFLHNEAQKGEAQLPSYTQPSLSLDYITDPNGLTSAAGMVTGSMLSIAPVAALIPESAVAGAVTAASKVPKIGGPLSRFVGNAIRWAPTGPVEAAMEGGAVEREMLENGASREDANRAAWDVFKGNAALLTATNAVEGGLLGKLVHKAPTFSNPIANTFSKIFNYVPQTAAEMAVQGYEEGAQEGISRAAMGQGEDSFSQILNPVDWTDEQWDAAKMGAAGSFPLVGGTAMMRHLQGALSSADDTEDAPTANNAPTLTSGNAEIDDAIVSAAAKHGLPADLLFAVAQTESDFDQSSVSSTGAKGIMQLMPDTAAALGVDADDMVQNIEGGARYLKQQLDDFGGNVEMALAAYNAGPGAVEKYKGVPPYTETQNYVAKIMGILDGANMNPAMEEEPARSLIDDAAPFIGTRMVNGSEGCVEAVTKIGAAGSDFLRAELDAGVVNVDRLVEDAGDRVIPFDPSKLEEGDVIVYGDKKDAQRHVVLYDGKGGYIGNSSRLELVVHRDDYNAMGSYYPTKIIKSGGRYGGTVNISSVSGRVRPIDYSGLVVDAKNLQANAAAMKALIEGDKLTPAQKAAIIDAAEIIRDTPTEASTASPGEDALDYNAWQRLIDHKDIKGIFAKDPERVTRMVMRGEETQRKAQTVAAIENQQKVAQAQSVQAQVQAAAQAQPVANPAESAARLASVQQELSMPPMAQQEIAARLASYAQTTPNDVERVVIQNGLAHGDFTGIARALPEVYRAAAGRWMQQPQEQAQAQPQAQPPQAQPQPQTQPPQPTAMPAQQDMQVPNVQANDVAVPPSQEMTEQMPQQMQGQAQAVPTTEDLADIRQKLAALDAMMQGNPTYVEARRRGDWQTAAQEAAKAGHHDFARFYQMLHEKATGAPINITPYQNPAEKAAAEQGAVRPTPAPVPINHVDSMRPIDIPKSYGARRDFGRGLIKAMRMRNLPDVRALNDDLRNGEKRAIEHALKRIAQVDAEDALLRGETAAQRANDNETVQAESREKQGDNVQVESAQKQSKEKTANEGGLELADGYTTESGRPLSEADEKEFIIKPNGSRNFGEITKTISDAVMQQSGESLPIGEIRLRVGNEIEGLIHAKAHTAEAKQAGYSSVEELIADVAQNFNQIYMRAPDNANGKPTYSLVKTGNKKAGIMNGVAPVYFELQSDDIGNYYIVVTAMPKGDSQLARQTKKDRLIYSSPGLGAATVSGDGAVSHDGSAGAVHRGGSPTSDKSSGLVTSTIPSDVSESKQKRASSANGEGNGSTAATAIAPMRTRRDGEDALSSVSNVPSEQEKSKGKSVQAKSAPLTKQEQEALTGTSEEAKEAYRIVRDKLAKSKNKSVVRAAKVGATLFARHADIYAKAYSKATGKPYTALDYLQDKFGLDVDGKEAEGRENAFGQRKTPLSDAERKKMQFRIIQDTNPMNDDIHTGVRSTKDILSAKEAFETKVDENSFAYPDFTEADGRTALRRGYVEIYSSHPIVLGTFVTPSQMQAKDYAGSGRVYSERVSLQDVAWLHSDEGQYAPVEQERFDQSAWHGTPHKFKKFDLGAIGTGEGAQVHGWGLYFAQQKSVGKGYREGLTGGKWRVSHGDEVYEFDYDTGDLIHEGTGSVMSHDDPETLAIEAFIGSNADKYGALNILENALEDKRRMFFPGEALDEEVERIEDAIELLENEWSRFDVEPSGSLFHVEIPDNDVLLDEQKPLEEQPKIVKLLDKYAEKIDDWSFTLGEAWDGMTGKEFYEYISDVLHGDKAASEYLNEAGIKGITYEGQRDGRCFVIFDDEAIEIIEKFNQRMNSIRKGSITPQASGRRIISLFEQADESTFLHEMGHMFLMDLEDIASLDEASAEDLEMVRDWATWQEGQVKEYEDTPWQKEFAEREKAILAAKKRGDVVEVKKLKREWEQERFARGFERYLETGKAPTSVLKRIFQKFKKFLQSIYQAFKGTGGKASPKVEAVMGRMIAEEEQGASSEFDGNPVQEKSAPIPADFSASKLKGAIGKTTSIATDSGEEIPVRYRLVDARSLVTSNNAKDFTKNPAYPKSLQPRDRERANMQQQIREMASRLRPEDLAASRSVNLDAPVVRADGVVLNGNGRAIAITRALLGNTFRDSTGKGYRAFLVEHAEEFGFKPETVQRMKAPMLVREVTGGLNAEQVKAVTTSTAGGSRLGASEQAKQDAEKITLEDLARYEENERGDLTTAANRDFVAGILYRVAGKNDVNAYTDAKGQVNADGIQRVKRALFQKAYGDDDLLSRMSESTNDDTRNITNGLTIAAPYIARANEKMARGTAHNYKLGETIADAVKRYNHLHGIGQSVENYLDQQAMFAEYEDSPEVREVLSVLNENRRSGKRIAQFVRRVGEIVEAQGNPNEISLMEGGEPLSLGDVIREAQKGLNAAEAAPILDTLFQEAPALKDAALEYGATEKDGEVTFENPEREKEFLRIAEALQGDVAKKLSAAWTGSSADFDNFDMAYVGTGVGAQAHGYGLHMAKERQTAEGYRSERGKLYHVEIPDNDVLLDEQKSFDEQPLKVRKALEKVVRSFTLEQLENWNDVRRLGKARVVAEIMDALSESNGMNIYGTISDLVEGQKEASTLLNQYGIKGITYHGTQSGRCYVIFDDKAIKILEKFSARRQEALSKVLKEVELIAPEKLTKRQQGIADFGKEMGMPVVFFKGAKNLHGFHASNGVTFLNTESETSLRWTFWHEALHWMKANNEELFKEIIEDVEKAGAFTKAQLDGYRKAIGAPELSDADVIEEMLADALPDVKKRVPFLKDLGKRNKSLAERFVGWIREVMDRFRDFFAKPQMGLTKAQSAAMRDAFAALARDMVDERGRRIFRVDGFNRRIALANGSPLPAAKYSLDNGGRQSEEASILMQLYNKGHYSELVRMDEENRHLPHGSTRKQANVVQADLLKKYRNLDITNKSTGEIARITKDGAGKMVSDKAIAKSIANGFSGDEHLQAVSEIKALFENGELIRVAPDKKGSADIQAIKHFWIRRQDGSYANILVKQYTDARIPQKIYTLELQELKKPSDLKDVSDEHPSEGVEPDATALGFGAPRGNGSISNFSITQKGEEGNRNLYEKPRLAPNGKPSNLTKEQYEAVRTPAFKAWFGDWEHDAANASKVVDENGEPLVVYHGTPLGGFNTFKRQQNYFTSMKWYADRYQDESTSSNFVPDKHENPAQKMTYAVFLNIKKPFDTRNKRERTIFEKEFYRQWGYGAPLSDKGLPDWTDGDDLQEFFEEKGYDYDGLLLDEGGIQDNNGGVISRGISYVTFEPNQIKSATDNIGAYNTKEDDIRFSVKFSRDSSKPGSMGRFRKLLVGLKIGEAAEKNLEVHRSNKEKQLVISASKLNQFMADKSLTEKNILKTEDLGGGKIRVTYMPQDFHNIHILDWVKSVRQLRKKNPFVKAIYDLGSRAMRLQEHLRNDGAKTVKEFCELTKNKNDRKLVTNILLEGDAQSREFSTQELRAMGANTNVIKAYQLVRRKIKEWYKRINDARMQVRTRTKTLSKNDLAGFKKNHWIQDNDVLSVEEKGGGKVLLTWRGIKTYETLDRIMTKEELDALLQDKDINVTHFHKLNDSYGVDNYSVDYVERIKPLGNLTGYIPHFFHEWMVYEKHKDPKTGEVRLTTIGSGRSMNDAIRLGNDIARKNSDKEYVVRPKSFDLNVENSVIIGDADFQKMAEKLADETQMTLPEANAFLRDRAGATRRARHRFFGNAMHRTGAKGFDTDITYVLTHYFNVSARYIAMEGFKPQAITLYERWLGAFDAEPKDDTAKYVKGLIKDINGDPRPLEKSVSELIMKTPIGKMISDAYGDRAALAVNGELSTWNAISKLGLGNFASMAVNFSQFINIGAAMNDYGYAAKGFRSALHPTAADVKILEESGVLDEINQAADNGGYTQRRFGRVGSVYGAIKRGGELSLLPFQYADVLMRKTAILGAYKQGVEKLGLSHEEAMERARDINYDANFDYSAANAPLMIRAGSVVTQQMFQFQKYPIMQMEFMYNILKNGTRGQKVRFLLPYVLMCGIPGTIPFGAIFNQIFSFLFHLATGDDKDIGDEIKAEALRWAGKDPVKKAIVNASIYGVLAPVFGIDVSKRIGISGAFSGEFFGAQKPESVLDVLGMQLGGPMASTAVNMANQIHNGNPIEALKAFSPALGNMAQAMVGVSRTTRHRVKSRYEATYDRIIHAMGFRSVDESNNSFITSYEFDRKDAETHAKQEAIMDYLDDPSEANRQRINALGIKDKAIEEARIQQERSATERAKGGRPKVESGKTSKRRTSHKRKEEKPKKETLFDTIGEEDEGM